MTPNEFQAWFAGFTEGIGKLPTAKQWARVVARVSEIDAFSFVITPPITAREREVHAAALFHRAFSPDGADSASVDDWKTAAMQVGRAEYRASA